MHRTTLLACNAHRTAAMLSKHAHILQATGSGTLPNRQTCRDHRLRRVRRGPVGGAAACLRGYVIYSQEAAAQPVRCDRCAMHAANGMLHDRRAAQQEASRTQETGATTVSYRTVVPCITVYFRKECVEEARLERRTRVPLYERIDPPKLACACAADRPTVVQCTSPAACGTFRCMLHAARCMLHIARRMLCCMLNVACCMSHAARCMLCCMLHDACCTLHAARRMLHVACYVACCMLHVACYVACYVAWCTSHDTRRTVRVAWCTSHACAADRPTRPRRIGAVGDYSRQSR